MAPVHSQENNQVRPDHAATITHLLRQGTPVTFRAGGPSMTPTLRDGDTVRVRPIRPRDPRPGAIALYPAHRRLILHRVVRVDRKTGTAYMAADAQLSGTERIPLAALAGTAHWVLKNGVQHRLDRWSDRWAGMAWYYLRPLRRAVQTRRHTKRPRSG